MKFRNRARGMLAIVAVFLGPVSCSRDVEQSIEPTPVIAIDPVCENRLRAAIFDEDAGTLAARGGTGIEFLRQGRA